MSSDPSFFSVVPPNLMLDPRLTKRHLRVMLGMLSFRSKKSSIVWPSRAALAARCGILINHISRATRELEEMGWLRKAGDGGCSKSCRYEILCPDLSNIEGEDEASSWDDEAENAIPSVPNRYENSTKLVQKPVDNSGSDVPNRYESVPNRYENSTKLVRGKEPTNEPTKNLPKEKNKHAASGARSARSRFVQVERPSDVTPEVWESFIAQRRARKAPVTSLALKGFQREAAKAGMTLDAVLTMCCERGWQGFRADWASVGAAGGRNGEGGGVVHSRRRLPPQETFMQPGYSYSDSWDDVFRKDG